MGEELETLRAERVALNEVTFRGANETVRDAADRAAVADLVPFICECGDAACLELVHMSVAEYERVRDDPRLFFVLPGHEITGRDLGRVVRAEPGYTVVEKIGVSGEVARRRDPRQRTAKEADS